VRRDLADPRVSGTTTGSERELGQLTRLVAMRVGIAVPDWVLRCVQRGVANGIARAGAYWSMGAEGSRTLYRNAELVGWKAAEEVEGKVSELLAVVEDLRPVPPRVLGVLQEAVPYPAGVLEQARVPRARRDRLAIKLYPDDVYNVAPRSLAELHPMMPELLASWEEARFAVVRERYRV
jgi:hypothetical protein